MAKFVHLSKANETGLPGAKVAIPKPRQVIHKAKTAARPAAPPMGGVKAKGAGGA